MSEILYKRIEFEIGNTVVSIVFSEVDNNYVTNAPSGYHSHLFYELHYIKNSELKVDMENRETKLVLDNEIYIIPKGMRHSIQMMKKGGCWLAIMVDFEKKKGYLTDTYSTFMSIFKENKPVLLKNESRYISEVAEIKNSGKMNEINMMRIKNFLSLMFIDFYEKSISNIPENRNEKLKYNEEQKLIIEGYLYENDVAGLRLDVLADILHISEKQTDRILKKYTGKNFGRIAKEIKIEKAEELILTTGFTLSEIGMKVGYSTYTGFCRAFRAIKGMSPGEFRRSLRV